MFCHKCGREFGNNDAFCRHCGTLKRREQDSVLCSSADEKFATEQYFRRGFRCKTIVHFLVEYHGISINERTMKRRLRQYGLRRRNQAHSEHTVREIIKLNVKLMVLPHFLDIAEFETNLEQATMLLFLVTWSCEF